VTEGRAVFLDRDGTIIEDTGYLADPASVRLLPGAAEAIGRLNRAGWVTIVVTNQSGIARGLLDEAAYADTTRRMSELLAAGGARLDAHYHCPHHPDFTGPCECRKPGPLLYQRAAADHDLRLSHCWWVGDRLRDVLPARRFGGRALLIRRQAGGEIADRGELPDPVTDGITAVGDLSAAVDIILGD
jgi:D-glycero-D-manno-heptose 1,7-bisphosphate phosphatase